jgi:hypothetical protein
MWRGERDWLRCKWPRIDGSYPRGVKDKIPRIFPFWSSIDFAWLKNC